MTLKKTAKKLIHALGYDVRRRGERRSGPRTGIGESYALMRDLGLRPATVVDVGAATGTEKLYAAFPEAHLLLVEPLAASEPALRAVLERYRGSYVLAAASAEAGEVTFNVHDEYPQGSSIYKETMGPEADGHEIVVPTVRLDDVIAEQGLDGPFLIKVDVQGAELDVLDGAPRALAEALAVVLEVSLFEFMQGAPQLHDVVAYMEQRGFVAWDIVPGWCRPLDDALGQVDIAFVPEAGSLRHDHSYATVEQLEAFHRDRKGGS